MSKGIILHLCADTGSDSAVWADNGYEVIKVGSDIGVENFSAHGMSVYGVFANPVCTEFSIAPRGTSFRDRNPEDGLFLVRECQRVIEEANPAWWAIENPASGSLRNYIGNPDFTYQPWEFGSPWTKRTALWGTFNPPTKRYTRWEDVPDKIELYVRPGRTKPSLVALGKADIRRIPEFQRFKSTVKTNAEFRSLCSQKFAQAFYDANNADGEVRYGFR